MSMLVRHSSRQKETRNGLSAVGFASYTNRPRNRHRYCGKEKDSESGLYYYGARYYESWTCRFVSVDPLAEKYAQLSSYNYADNSHVTDLDVDGLQSTGSATSEQGGEPTYSGFAIDRNNNNMIPVHGLTNNELIKQNLMPVMAVLDSSGDESRTALSRDATRVARPVMDTFKPRPRASNENRLMIHPDATRVNPAPVLIIGDRKRSYDQEFGYVLRNTMGGASGNSYLPDAKYTETIDDLVSYLGAYNPAHGWGKFTGGVLELYNEVAAIVKSYLIGKELEKQEEADRLTIPTKRICKKPAIEQSNSVQVGDSIVTRTILRTDTNYYKTKGIPAVPHDSTKINKTEGRFYFKAN